MKKAVFLVFVVFLVLFRNSSQAAEYNASDACEGMGGALHVKNDANGVTYLVCFPNAGTDFFTNALYLTNYGMMQLPVINGAPCTATEAGAINFSTASGAIMQYCDGTTWVTWGSTPTVTGDPPSYSGPGGTAAGSQGEVQFNLDGTLLGSTSFLFWDDSNQRFGVNTQTPSTILHIGTASGQWTQGGLSFGGGNIGIYESASNVLALRTGGSNRVFVNNTGLGVKGTASTALHINSASGSFSGAGLSFGSSADTGLYESADDVLALRINGTDSVFLNATGLGIGAASTTAALEVTGDIHYSGTLVDTSDRRAKDNINEISGSLDKINRLKAVTFTQKGDQAQALNYGLVAQDVQEVYPDLVHAKGGDNMLGVDYIGLIGPLIHAVQELSAENERLRVRIEKLERDKANE